MGVAFHAASGQRRFDRRHSVLRHVGLAPSAGDRLSERLFLRIGHQGVDLVMEGDQRGLDATGCGVPAVKIGQGLRSRPHALDAGIYGCGLLRCHVGRREVSVLISIDPAACGRR